MENHLPHTNNSPEISPTTPEIEPTVSLGRRGFLCRTGIVAIALAGCNPDKEIQNSNTPKTKTLEIKSVKDLEHSAEILEDYQKNRMHHPDFLATKAARNNLLRQSPHKLITEDGIPQDKSMTITFSDHDGKNPTSVTMPILTQDKNDPSKNECITGRIFVVNGKTYKIETSPPTKKDTGVANQFIITSVNANSNVDTKANKKKYKVLAVKRASYQKGYGYKIKSVAYTPPAEEYVTDENVKAGREYVRFVTDTAAEILTSMLDKSSRGDTNLIKNFIKRMPFIKEMVAKLMIVEHIDPGVYLNALSGDSRYSGISLQSLSRQSYTEYALNASQAFGYLDNSSDAMGPLQIRSDTYNDLLKHAEKYYGIDLEILKTDKELGRKDHIRAAVFAMLLCYDNFIKMKNNLRNQPELFKIFGEEIDLYEAMLVSNYNASTAMVHACIGTTLQKAKKNKKIFKNAKDFIVEYRLNMKNLGQKIKIATGESISENANYIKKYFDIK